MSKVATESEVLPKRKGLDKNLGKETQEYWQKYTKKQAYKFARSFGVRGSVNTVMYSQIGQSGYTAEDIHSELWAEALAAVKKIDDKLSPEQNASFITTCIDYKKGALRREIFAKKRGYKEAHLSGDDGLVAMGELRSYDKAN